MRIIELLYFRQPEQTTQLLDQHKLKLAEFFYAPKEHGGEADCASARVEKGECSHAVQKRGAETLYVGEPSKDCP